VSAVRGTYPARADGEVSAGAAGAGWRQGFLSDITNPEVLVSYLAVLPQFLGPGAPVGVLLPPRAPGHGAHLSNGYTVTTRFPSTSRTGWTRIGAAPFVDTPSLHR
jgi:hypothetical protein